MSSNGTTSREDSSREEPSREDTAPVDVLAGWDPAGPPPVLDGSAPFPTDTVIAVGAMVAGMALGIAVGGRHPLIRAKVGGVLGLAGAVAARRMWRLPG